MELVLVFVKLDSLILVHLLIIVMDVLRTDLDQLVPEIVLLVTLPECNLAVWELLELVVFVKLDIRELLVVLVLLVLLELIVMHALLVMLQILHLQIVPLEKQELEFVLVIQDFLDLLVI
jgi:hypothetical protein